MELLIFFLILAIGVSFMCSILEAVLLSISDSYVAMLSEEGAPYAKALRRLKDDIDRPLAAILSLNTIAHTVGQKGPQRHCCFAHCVNIAWNKHSSCFAVW